MYYSLFSPCHCLMSRIDEPASSGLMGRALAEEMARIHQHTGLQRAKLFLSSLCIQVNDITESWQAEGV